MAGDNEKFVILRGEVAVIAVSFGAEKFARKCSAMVLVGRKHENWTGPQKEMLSYSV